MCNNTHSLTIICSCDLTANCCVLPFEILSIYLYNFSIYLSILGERGLCAQPKIMCFNFQCKSHEQLAAVARTCAHVVDAVSFMSSNQRGLGAGTSSCSCLVSIDEPAPIPGLKVDVVQRWFPNVLQITSG